MMAVRGGMQPWLAGLTAGASVLLVGSIDWATGSELNFFVFYFLPVAIAAWFLGLGASLFIAVACALVWFGADVLGGHAHFEAVYAVWNTLIRLASFLVIGWSTAKIRSLLLQEREASQALRRSLSEIKVLEGILPICAVCKKIRNVHGYWEPLEVYIGGHSDTRFSHGYCPECARRAMAEAGLIDERGAP